MTARWWQLADPDRLDETAQGHDTVGHPVRYPLLVGEVYRATCRCHWWMPLPEAGEWQKAVTR